MGEVYGGSEWWRERDSGSNFGHTTNKKFSTKIKRGQVRSDKLKLGEGRSLGGTKSKATIEFTICHCLIYTEEGSLQVMRYIQPCLEIIVLQYFFPFLV